MTDFVPSPYPVVFLSYDEPNADDNYKHLLTIVPNALRVHGVKGFDAAHKEASRVAHASSPTSSFFTVDGDNQLLAEPWQALILQLRETVQSGTFNYTQVHSWRAYNTVNALCYGNGGLKLWPHRWVQQMKTHEASDEGVKVDFCWDGQYAQHTNIVSRTIINKSPEQAWRAGFREGVKMSLHNGTPQDKFDLGQQSTQVNVSRFVAWASLGADAPNGNWSVLGALMGFAHVNDGYRGNEHEQIIDYDKLTELFEGIETFEGKIDAQELHRLREVCLRFNIKVPQYGVLQSQTCKWWMTHSYRNGPDFFEIEKWLPPLITPDLS